MDTITSRASTMASRIYSQPDDVSALAETVESLKISALVNAAKISPLVRGTTIGPLRSDTESESNGVATSSSNGNDSSNRNQSTSNHTNNKLFINNNNNLNDVNKNSVQVNMIPYDPKKSQFRSDVWRDVRPDSEECDSSRHMLQLSDCKFVSFRLKATSVEKERRAKLSSDLQTKQAEWSDELERRLQKIRIDAAEKQRQTQAKRLEREMAVLNLIEEIEAQAKQDELISSQREVDMIEHSRKLIERANQLKRADELRLMLEIVSSCKTLFINLYECFAATIINCEDVLNDAGKVKEYKQKRDSFLQRYESIMNTVNSRAITSVEVETFETLCDDLKAEQSALDKYVDETKEAISQAAAAASAAAAAEAEAKAAAAAAAAQAAANAVTTSLPPAEVSVTDGPRAHVNTTAGVTHAGSEDRIAQYNQLIQYLDQYKATIQPLLADPNMKKFRFNCQKAVNLPVNAICVLKSESLQDKFEKITQLLAGKQVYCCNVQFSAAEHPLGVQYCTMLLAQKFITQGTTVLATNNHLENVYTIAAVFVAVWQHFPEVGHLFLALLYKECPFFVPYYIKQQPNQSVNDYLKQLGYQFTDGVMEEHGQYLNRITGLQRLYSAIMVTKLRRSQAQSQHPHGLENAWIWLSNMLMLKPEPEIFAALILRFMEICGPEMLTAYGKQFVKLIIALRSQYIPKLEQIDSGGPLSRLKELIEKIITEGRIEPLKGALPANFW